MTGTTKFFQAPLDGKKFSCDSYEILALGPQYSYTPCAKMEGVNLTNGSNQNVVGSICTRTILSLSSALYICAIFSFESSPSVATRESNSGITSILNIVRSQTLKMEIRLQKGSCEMVYATPDWINFIQPFLQYYRALQLMSSCSNIAGWAICPYIQ